MKNAKFFLRRQGKSDPVIVFQLFDSRFKGRKFMYSTGRYCSDWDKRRERPRADAYLSKHLDLIEQSALEFISQRASSRTLAREDLKAFILSRLKDERRNAEQRQVDDMKDKEVFVVWQRIIDTTKTPKGEPVKNSTKTQKAQTLKTVQLYASERNPKLSFKTMDINFYHDFDAWMREKQMQGNTRGKHFKEIKAICREAAERDIEVNPAYLKKSWRVIKSKSDSVYLNAVEIRKIMAADLPHPMSVHRDIFIMACFVGARHSDWNQIKPENIITEGKLEILRYKQTKTGDVVHVPLHPVVKAILLRYPKGIRVISNQKFNDALKDIAEAAELGSCTINGQTVEKSKLITTHTARRSFATNAYLSKSMDVLQIMRCTGHKTEKSFLDYLKLDGRDYAAMAAESRFFTEDWTMLKIA